MADGVLFIFYIVTAIYVVFTAIFYYHWQQYGANAKVTWITYIVYLVTTVPPMFVMGVIALAI